MGANLSSNQLVFADNSEVSIYDLTSESWSFVFVEEDLLLGSIAGWTNSYVTPYGYDSTTVLRGMYCQLLYDHTDDQLTRSHRAHSQGAIRLHLDSLRVIYRFIY